MPINPKHSIILLLTALSIHTQIIISTSTSSSTSSSSTPQKYSQKILSTKDYLSLTFPQAGICGIMGNIAIEAPSFDYRTKQIGGNGYGIFQLDFLKPHYFLYLLREKKKDSMESQVDFMVSTIQGEDVGLIGAGVAAKIVKALDSGDVDTATTVFMKLWERPGVPALEKRKAKAREFCKNLFDFV